MNFTERDANISLRRLNEVLEEKQQRQKGTMENCTLYTCWTEPSLTFDLLCRLRSILDEAKLSPSLVLICTTNRM